MTATGQKFKMFQGDSKEIILIVKDELGNPVDITGSSVKWGIRQKEISTENVFIKTVGDGIDLTDPINGQITIKLNPADTATIKGKYFFEAELTDPNKNVSTIATGSLQIDHSGV